jgi:hypothetical protein
MTGRDQAALTVERIIRMCLTIDFIFLRVLRASVVNPLEGESLSLRRTHL